MAIDAGSGLPKQIPTAEHLFEPETVDFNCLIQSLPTAPGEFGQTATEHREHSLVVRTLGGTEMVLAGLSRETTVEELRVRAAQCFKWAAFTIKFLAGTRVLDDDGQRLGDIGLAVPGAAVVLVRCPGDPKECRDLFSQLLRAIHSRRPEEARRLVDKGAGLDCNSNPLRAAVRMRRPGDWTAQDDEDGNTMLHLAIREGLTDLSLYLIARGISIESTNDALRTPLMQAVMKRQVVVAKTLLDQKADVTCKDYLGNTTLSYALRQGNDELSSRLFAASPSEEQLVAFVGMAMGVGAPIEEPMGPGAEILKCCASSMPLTALALIEAQFPLHGPGIHGHTALQYARDRGMTTVVDALLTHGYGRAPDEGVGVSSSEGEHGAAPLSSQTTFRRMLGILCHA